MKKILVAVTEEQHRALSEVAKRQGQTLAAVIRIAFDEYLKEQSKS